jgi:hypothetical protein
VSGSGLGASASDIGRVLVGGVDCAAWAWVSAAQLTCTVPSPHPIWTAARAEPWLVTPAVLVSVVLASGLETPDAPAASFAPAGIRTRADPAIRIRGLFAWREVGDASTLRVRWRYPRSDLEAALNAVSTSAAATAFEVQTSVAADADPDLNSENSEFEVGLKRAVVAREDAATGASTEDRGAGGGTGDWFETSLLVSTPQPVAVRVRATNSDGNGPWTVLQRSWHAKLAALTPSTCKESEFLATHASKLSGVVCRPCPLGSLCGGLDADNVTAQQGYWRVPWSADALGFASCPLPSSCTGLTSIPTLSSSPSSSSSSSSLPNASALEEDWRLWDTRTRPQALALATSMEPEAVERCAAGYAGVLCASCAVGYYPSSGGVCLACGAATWILARFLLLVLGVFAALAALLSRAWLRRSESSSKEVQIIKILFSHLQMIAIVGGVQLRWPSEARGFLNAVDTTSSFSTSGLAVECLLGSASSSPFLRTVVVVLMPVGLLAFAFAFWAVMGALEQRFSRVAACIGDESDATSGPNAATRPPLLSRLSSGPSLVADEEFATLNPSLNPSLSPSLRKPSDKSADPRSTPGKHVTRSSSARTATDSPPSPSSTVSTVRPTCCTLLRDRVFISFVIIAFLVHTPLSTAAFRLLTCRDIAPDDDPSSSQLRLVMDLNVLCTDPAQRAQMLGLALPVLVLVSLGIPVGAAIGLRAIGREALQDPRWRSLLGFLVNGYKPKLYFWESVVLLRKVSVAFVTTTLTPAGAGIQVTTALIVLLVALVLHARFHPYVSKVINSLESLALVTAALSFVSAQFIVLEAVGAAGSAAGVVGAAASVTIVVLNVLFLVTALALLSSKVRDKVSESFVRLAEWAYIHTGIELLEGDVLEKRFATLPSNGMRQKPSSHRSLIPQRAPSDATPTRRIDRT